MDELEELRQRVAELEDAERQRFSGYQAFIEQTTDAVWCFEYDEPIPIDLPVEEQIGRMVKATLVECNDVCARVYGKQTAAEAVGIRFEDLVSLEEESFLDGLRHYARNNYTARETVNVQPLDDGTSRYLRNNAQGVVEDGRLVRVWGTFRDVTEQMEADDALAISEAQFRTLVESSIDVILKLDENRRITYMNRDPRAEYGMSWADIEGQLADNFTDAASRPDAIAAMDQVLAGGEPTTFESSSATTNNKYYVSVSPLRASDTKLGALLIMRNVTEIWEANRQRELLLAELDHRVKNTLAMLVVLSKQTIAQATTLEEFDQAFTSRLTSLARVHEALAAGKWSALSLREVVTMTIGAVGGEGCHLAEDSFNPSLPARMVGPLAMVLHELSTNAVKYGALVGGGGTIEIRSEFSSDHGVTVIWREHCSQPLSEGESLGLSLVRGLIAQDLGGRFEKVVQASLRSYRIWIPLEEPSST